MTIAWRYPTTVTAAVAALAACVIGAAAAIEPAAAPLLATAIVLAAVIALRPEVGGWLLVATVPVTAGLRRGLLIPGLRPAEVIITGIAVIVIVACGRGRAPRWGAFDWLALAYVAATVGLGGFDLVARGEPLTTSALGTLLGPLQFLLLYRAVATALPSEGQRRVALRLLLLSSLAVSAAALLQLVGGPVRPLLASLTGSDLFAQSLADGQIRATGPFPIWHNLGGYLMTVVLIGVALALEPSRRVLSPRWTAIVVGAAAAALLATATAAPIAGAVGGVLYLAHRAGRLRLVAGRLVVAGLIGALLFSPILISRLDEQFSSHKAAPESTAVHNPLVPETLAYRYELFEHQSLPALRGRWLTGYGPEQPPELRLGNFAWTESAYITVLLRGGVPLLLTFGALMVGFFALGRAAQGRGSPTQVAVGRVLVAVVVILVPIHLIETYFLDTGPPHVLWALAGVAAARRPGG